MKLTINKSLEFILVAYAKLTLAASIESSEDENLNVYKVNKV